MIEAAHIQPLLRALIDQDSHDDNPEATTSLRAAHCALLDGVQLIQRERPDHRGAIAALHEAHYLYRNAGETRFKPLVQQMIGLLSQMTGEDATRLQDQISAHAQPA